MPKTVEYANPSRVKLIEELRKASREKKAGIWEAVAEELARPRKNRRSVNVWRVNLCTEKGDVIVVPGKLLGDGSIDHKVTIAALNFTDSAKKKIESAGGELVTIQEMVKKNPEGSGITIIG